MVNSQHHLKLGKLQLHIFSKSKSSIAKGCPKNTFLGLCEEGLVKEKKRKGNYTKSIKNKKYAISAVNILKTNLSQKFTPGQLWNKLCLDLDLRGNHITHK